MLENMKEMPLIVALLQEIEQNSKRLIVQSDLHRVFLKKILICENEAERIVENSLPTDFTLQSKLSEIILLQREAIDKNDYTIKLQSGAF